MISVRDKCGCTVRDKGAFSVRDKDEFSLRVKDEFRDKGGLRDKGVCVLFASACKYSFILLSFPNRYMAKASEEDDGQRMRRQQRRGR